MTTPRSLKVDGLRAPIGGISTRPRLTWRYDGAGDGFLVRAVLSSGEVVVEAVVGAEVRALDWPGDELSERDRFTWQVAALAGDRKAWSDPATGEVGILGSLGADAITHQAWVSPGDVAPAALPELRTLFTVGDVALARLYLGGSGVVVPLINGMPAITGNLEPGYAALDGVTPAYAWDITSLLRSGDNELVLRLGGGTAYSVPQPGRYAKFKRTGHAVFAQAQLVVTAANGSEIVLGTDETWQARLGSLLVSSWYGGETQAAEPVSAWGPAAVIPEVPPTWWRSSPPIEVTEELSAIAVTNENGVRVFDFGVNAAGRPVLDLAHPAAGQRIVLTPAEVLAQGRADQSTTGTPIFDEYRASAAQWKPATVYHGARYYEVSGLAQSEGDDAVRLEVMRAANERVGTFTSSDPTLDRLHGLIDRAIQGNMYSVFTDCPHREKLGWLEQLHYVFGPLARGYDVQAHLTDMVRHMIGSQRPDGLIPTTAPELVVFDFWPHLGDLLAFRSDPNWGRAILAVPWRLYEHYGDARVLEMAWPAARGYLDYLEARSRESLLDFGLGDWVALDESTPRRLTASHGWALALEDGARIARVLGDDRAARDLTSRAQRVWSAIGGLRDARGVWGSGSQGSLALAWTNPHLGDAEHQSVGQQLLEQVSGSEAFTVGEIALPHLLQGLSALGADDLIQRVIRREDVPGYGLQIASGATALTESWEGAGGAEGVVSQNHFMLGAIDAWLLERVAGLRQSAGSIGWGAIDVAPAFLPGVESAATTFDSPAGLLGVDWRRLPGGQVSVSVTAPASVAVTLALPAGGVLTH